MSGRIDKSWTVLDSVESDDGCRCVDLFRRPNATFGYEEFRRDPEDQGTWTPVQFASALTYKSLEDARAAAESAIGWMPRSDVAVGPAAP